MENFTKNFFENASQICLNVEYEKIDSLATELAKLRTNKGRLFILGVGGSAGNASHAVNDFRKLCGIEAYAPTDNVSELTARTNDEGWETIFENWLKISNFNSNDGILIFSVGGGNLEKKVSVNLINAINLAKEKKSKIFSVVGKSDGYAYSNSNISILVPNPIPELVTPHSEAFQSVIWHCLVSHPLLQICDTKW